MFGGFDLGVFCDDDLLLFYLCVCVCFFWDCIWVCVGNCEYESWFLFFVIFGVGGLVVCIFVLYFRDCVVVGYLMWVVEFLCIFLVLEFGGFGGCVVR